MIYAVLTLLLAFTATMIGIPFAKKYLLASAIYGIDQQKQHKPKLPTSGGVVVFFSFITAITFYVGSKSLFSSANVDEALILAALASVNIITLIGLIDDIHIDFQKLLKEELDAEQVESIQIHEKVEYIQGRGEMMVKDLWHKIPGAEDKETDGEHRQGLSQLPKMLFVLPAAFPLIAVGAGSWSMRIPVIGLQIHWGLIYPLILLPLGLLFVANVVNMLAGTNGLSTVLSFITSTGLAAFAAMNGEMEAMIIAASLSAALLAFYFYNRYPASILPGDSLTYLCGAGMFSAMVIGNMEKFGATVFVLWFVEFGLKARSRFNAKSWGRVQEDKSLRPHSEEIYSLTHIFMRKGFNEKQITEMLALIQALIVSGALILYTVFI